MFSVNSLLKTKGVSLESYGRRDGEYGFKVVFPQEHPHGVLDFEDDFWLTNQHAFEKTFLGTISDCYNGLLSRTTLQQAGRSYLEAKQRTGKQNMMDILKAVKSLKTEEKVIELTFADYVIGDYEGQAIRIPKVSEKQIEKLKLLCKSGIRDGDDFLTKPLMAVYDFTEIVADVMALPDVDWNVKTDVFIEKKEEQSVSEFCPNDKQSEEVFGDQAIIELISEEWNKPSGDLDVEQRKELFYKGFARGPDGKYKEPSIKQRSKMPAMMQEIGVQPIVVYCKRLSKEISKMTVCNVRGAAGQVLRLKGQFILLNGCLQYVGNIHK